MEKGYTISPGGLIQTIHTMEFASPEVCNGKVVRIIIVTDQSVVAVPMAEVRANQRRC